MQHCTSGKTGSIHERLKYLRKTLGLSQEEFGKRIGKSLRTIQYWEAGTVQIPDTALKLISQIFGVSYEWLKTGQGEMWEKKEKIEEEEETLRKIRELILEDLIEKTVEFLKKFEGGKFAVEVRGDSMEPTLHDGDFVVFKPYVGDGSDIPNGKVVVVRNHSGELIVKRLIKINGLIMLTSDNPKYPPIPPEQIKTEDLRIVGVAVKIVREILV